MAGSEAAVLPYTQIKSDKARQGMLVRFFKLRDCIKLRHDHGFTTRLALPCIAIRRHLNFDLD